MNQTQKRLQIINIAISITDIDTIQLQVLKLNQIKTDERLTEIIENINNQNYAKAQTLIQQYISQPISDDIIQRVDEYIMDETDLYEEEVEEQSIELDLDDMLQIHQDKDKKAVNEELSTTKEFIEIDFDNLLNINVEDVKPQEVKELTLSDMQSPIKEQEIEHKPKDKPIENIYSDTYSAISYIRQKFKDMIAQYPIKHPKTETYMSVDRWLSQIETEGYSEANIEEMIDYIYKISNTKPSEAAQLLLVSAATQSIYAQFILARELYKGILLEQQIEKSFSMIYHLAINENYPEAICDLAQFYEYGVGVKKDTKQALKLYDEAMQLGITRAMRNYDRLSKQKKSLFGLF